MPCRHWMISWMPSFIRHIYFGTWQNVITFIAKLNVYGILFKTTKTITIQIPGKFSKQMFIIGNLKSNPWSGWCRCLCCSNKIISHFLFYFLLRNFCGWLGPALALPPGCSYSKPNRGNWTRFMLVITFIWICIYNFFSLFIFVFFC